MIVRKSHYETDEHAETHFGPQDGCCFFCGKPLEVPFTLWAGTGEKAGSTQFLRLHPGCVFDLWMRLGVDLVELKDKDAYRIRYEP